MQTVGFCHTALLVLPGEADINRHSGTLLFWYLDHPFLYSDGRTSALLPG